MSAQQHVYRLLSLLPDDVPKPDVSTEPEDDGSISLDWHRNPRCVLNVSVESNGALSWASVIYFDRASGYIQGWRTFPPILALLAKEVMR